MPMYNTGNPLGSSDPKDLNDNAQVFDKLVSGTAPRVTDRLGNERLSWSGLEYEFANAQNGRETAFQDFLASSSFYFIGDYGAGLTFTTRAQYTVRDGYAYRLAVTTTVPYTASGNWTLESDKFSLVYLDDILRQQLNEADGATLVRNGSETVAESLSRAIRKDSALTTGAALLPAGSELERPQNPTNGMLRYSTTTGAFEGYQGGAWSAVTNSDPWALQPIGVPIPVFSHLAGVVEPPTNKAYRYVKLTAADAYNTGVLASEAVSGSAPLVLATAVISLTGSPLNGQTVSLINTERRVVRASATSGELLNDALQNHAHEYKFAAGVVAGLALSTNNYAAAQAGGPANLATSTASTAVNSNYIGSPIASSAGAPRLADETRPKSIGATYYMRVK